MATPQTYNLCVCGNEKKTDARICVACILHERILRQRKRNCTKCLGVDETPCELCDEIYSNFVKRGKQPMREK